MIIGAHSIIYSSNPESDRAFFRDILRLTSVDVGGGWLIFGLPPAELAVHPSDKNNVHEFYLMVDDVEGFIKEMASFGLTCGPVDDQGWGLLTQVTLPGGGKLGVYQPRHERPEPMRAPGAKAARAPQAKAKPTAAKPSPAKASKKPAKAAKPAAKPAKPGKKPSKAAAPKRKGKKR